MLGSPVPLLRKSTRCEASARLSSDHALVDVAPARPLHAARRSATVRRVRRARGLVDPRVERRVVDPRRSVFGRVRSEDDATSPIHSRSSAASAAQVPRTNSSCSFVSSRATHASRSGVASARSPQRRLRSGWAPRRGRPSPGVSHTTRDGVAPRGAVARQEARRSGSARRPRGRSPTSAARTALAPGIGTTRLPAAIAALDERLARIAHRRACPRR